MLEPKLLFEDVLEEGGGNKSSNVKVIKTQPLLFPAGMEGLCEENNEPFYTVLMQA